MVVNVCCVYWHAIDWIYVLLAEASGCHRYFAHMDCLTVDEMEKFMVYDSGADCRKLIYFYFFLFFLTMYNYVTALFFKCSSSFTRVSPVLIQFCWIKGHIFADTRCLFLFFFSSVIINCIIIVSALSVINIIKRVYIYIDTHRISQITILSLIIFYIKI